MAKNTRYTVTHPDGTVSTRTSARTYTHVVVSAPATPRARKAALNRLAGLCEAHADTLEAAAAAAAVVAKNRGYEDLSDFNAFDYMLKGTEIRIGHRSSFEIWDRGNQEGLTQTWRRFVPDGTEVVRETKADHTGETLVAAPVKDVLVAKARERAASLRADAKQFREDAEQPDPEGYCARRWSSGPDAARRAISTFDDERARGRTVTVVPVDAPGVVQRERGTNG